MPTCGYCGQEFEANPHHTAKNKFCSENCRKRDWDAKNRVHCRCGAAMARRAKQCWNCELDQREEALYDRWALIKALYDAAVPVKEMIGEPGCKRSSVGGLWVEIDRMKKAGIEMPPRRPGWNGSTSSGPPRVIKPVYSPAEASMRVGHAIRSGRMTRPDECERCGAKVRVDAHHHDYSKPLDVEWLCRRCHTAHHAELRRVHPPSKVAA